MPRATLHPDVAALVQPLRSLLNPALDRLAPGPTLQVVLGDVPDVYALEGTTLTLSTGLLGPDMHHPAEPEATVRLDRWRRAASAILEGAALAALAEATERTPDLTDWRWVGAAVEAADHACSDLQLGLPDLVRAAEVAVPGADPRQGVAVYRSLRRAGEDPWAAASAWVRDERPVTAEQWLQAGRWTLGAGLAAEVGVPLELPARQDIPVQVPAWSWVPLEVPAHPRGGRVRIEGGAHVRQAWASGGEPLRTLAGALDEPGRLTPEVGGPVGTWENVSAHGFGQLFGVRGITWTLHGDGRLEMLLADAFAGPVEAIEMAENMGTSGIVPGRWRIAGEQALSFSDLRTAQLTMHGRDGNPFALPAGGGLGQALQALQEGAWRWRIDGDELFLTGRMMGGPLEMRFRRAADG